MKKIYEIADIILNQLNLEAQKRDSKVIVPAPKLMSKFIAEAEKDIQNRLNILESSVNITIANDIYDYALPEDFGELNLRRLIQEYGKEIDSIVTIYSNDTGKRVHFNNIYEDVITYTIPYYINLENYQADLLREDPENAPEIKLPNDVELALKYYVMAQVYPDYYQFYEKEINQLRSRRATTVPASTHYSLGGLDA